MLSGFPAVIVVLLSALELGGLLFGCRTAIRTSAGVLAGALMVFAPVTYFSGLFARDALVDRPLAPPPLEALDGHALFARGVLLLTPAVVLLFFLLSAVRPDSPAVRKVVGTLYAAALAGLLGTVVLTGYRGGELVFTYGAGVNPQSLPAPAASAP